MLISFLGGDDTGEVFFWEREQTDYISPPKNRCVALHFFPAAVSFGTSEASRSESCVITKFAAASSPLPDLLCIFPF